jgi:hypothetical protein
MFKFLDRFSSPFKDRSPVGSTPASASLAAFRQQPCSPALLTDSIHHRLDGLRPYGTPISSIQTLMARIRDGLKPRRPMANGRSNTMFEGIIADKGNLYSLKLPNSQHVTRTREETELHVLLQSRMRAVDPTWRDDGDSVDIKFLEHDMRAQPSIPMGPLRRSAAANHLPNPMQEPRPGGFAHNPATHPATVTQSGPGVRTTKPVPFSNSRATALPYGSSSQSVTRPQTRSDMPENQVREFVDRFRNKTRIYGSGVVDMKTVGERLLGQSHLLKEISGANNDCWWRAALLSAIIKCDPVVLEQTVMSRLEPEFQDDAAQLRRMGEAVRSEGVHRILTGMRVANLADDLARGSALKLPGYTDSQDGGRGEDVCRRIVNALLIRAGVPDDEAMSTVHGRNMGDMHHVAALLNQLKCETAVFSRPWGEFRPGQSTSFDPARSTVEICPQPGSFLDRVADDPSLPRRTENLLNELDNTPVLVHQGAHFNLAIPSTTFYLAGVRHPIQ